jgi:hypothetical protein
MHKSIPVAIVNLDEHLGVILSVVKLLNREHLPIGIPVAQGLPDYTKLTKWWSRRSIPASRSGFRQMLERLNIPTVEALIKECYGLSLSDQYWICPQGCELQWKNINFFNNGFSEDIGNLLLGGKVSSAKPNLISPDSTSDGFLKKRWKILNGKRCLIKGGSNPFFQEPLNEVIASSILNRLGIPHADYTLIWDSNYPYCVCDDFITEDTELVTAYQICETLPFREGEDLYVHFLTCCESLGIHAMADSIDRMLVLDYLIDNPDRHFGNFGAVRDANTLKWLGPAPIFDNGTSLWCATVNAFINPDADTESATFYINHKEQLKLVKNFDFLNIEALSGIEAEFDKLLKTSPYIDVERRQLLCAALKRRIELIEMYA